MPNNIIMADATGGYVASDWLDASKPTGLLTSDEVTIGGKVTGRTGKFSVNLPYATTIPNSFAENATGLEAFSAPNLSAIPIYALRYCTNLTSDIFCPKAQAATSSMQSIKSRHVVIKSIGVGQSSILAGCALLEAFDLVTGSSITGSNNFQNCASLNALILRSNSRVSLGNINNLTGTPFASGGTGGTIYIPKSLYDHLGDGTSDDYKAESNWSTIDGYGTITWAKIEGSTYETHYGDGTPIPSA